MINLLCVIPNMEDATSLYRGSGPIADLRRRMDVNVIFMDQVGENKLDFADVVFIQRAAGDNHLKLAEMCKQNNVPLWVDYDDLLLAVPPDNPAFEIYAQKKVRDSIIKIIQMADCVTVSTDQLKRCFQDKMGVSNPNVFTVPNALPDKYLHLAKPFQHKLHVNWRGSNTHAQDVMEYGAEIVELSMERKNTTFTWVGYNPWFVTKFMPEKSCLVVPALPIGDYFRFMSATNPAIQMVTLASNMFNLCKSSIAWLEGALAGAVCVAPDWPEWRNPGTVTYKDNQSFKQAIEYLLDNPKEAEALHKMSWEYIQKECLLSKVNMKRMDLLQWLYCGADPALAPEGGDPFPEADVIPVAEEAMELE